MQCRELETGKSQRIRKRDTEQNSRVELVSNGGSPGGEQREQRGGTLSIDRMFEKFPEPAKDIN